MSDFDIVPSIRLEVREALCRALETLQEHEQLAPNDPSLAWLKQSILTRITALDFELNRNSDTPPA
jgi:hypothetical protein